MFKLKSSAERSEERLLEEKLYEQVAQDLAQGKRREGIWAKALANSNGSQSQAQSLYIKYHVQALKDELHVENEISQQATQNEPKEPRKTQSDYDSYEEYIKDMIVQNTKAKEGTHKSVLSSGSFAGTIKNYILMSVVFIVTLFVGMLVGGLVLNILKPDLASPDFGSVAFLGWSFGFASLYFYLKKEWLKYISLGMFILFVIPLVL